MKKILGIISSAAWWIPLAIAVCAAVIFTLPEVITGGDLDFRAWIVFIPTAIVAAIGRYFCSKAKIISEVLCPKQRV